MKIPQNKIKITGKELLQWQTAAVRSVLTEDHQGQPVDFVGQTWVERVKLETKILEAEKVM